MAKRFKILTTAIKKYKAPTDTAGTAFYKFDQFRKGLTNYTVNGTARGDDELQSLVPFGTGGATDKLIVQVSGRLTDTNVSANALSKAELGLSDIADEDEYNENFVPAKIIVKKQGATTKPTSQITGVPYSKVAGATYSFPIGRKAGTDRQFDRQLALYNLVEAATGKFTVTFKPEQARGHGG